MFWMRSIRVSSDSENSSSMLTPKYADRLGSRLISGVEASFSHLLTA